MFSGAGSWKKAAERRSDHYRSPVHFRVKATSAFTQSSISFSPSAAQTKELLRFFIGMRADSICPRGKQHNEGESGGLMILVNNSSRGLLEGLSFQKERQRNKRQKKKRDGATADTGSIFQ